jgi:RNA-splicing ligase RtcB
MILKGKYTNASIFAETIDSETLSQIREIINQSFMENSNVAIMPDAHAGAGVCIGFTESLNGKVVPNFVGVDIGCGVTSQYIEGDVDCGRRVQAANGRGRCMVNLHWAGNVG